MTPSLNRRSRTHRMILTWLLTGAMLFAGLSALYGLARAAPIDPPEGYPKLTLSMKTVTPTLTHVGNQTLTYTVEIRNTGAYTAAGTTLTDTLPAKAVYNDDAWASHEPSPTVKAGVLTWLGDVGFDETVVIQFTVDVPSDFSGLITNTATISQAQIAAPVVVSAATTVTDVPILVLEKWAEPRLPGANQPLTYTLTVHNVGQPAVNLPITVTDTVPEETNLRTVGPDGNANAAGTLITWTRAVTLDLGASTTLTFSVDVGDVVSGTIITNDTYQVDSTETDLQAGHPHTITVVDPILRLTKSVWPDPPGSNREMTYTLTLYNAGSLATQMVITDRVPEGVSYVRGGSESGDIVSWTLPSLATGSYANLTYTVYVSDVLDLPVVNADFGVDCVQLDPVPGETMTTTVQGPHFATEVTVDPIAHKPGGGKDTYVTPTLVVRNLGPGNALGAQATLFFRRLSVSLSDLIVTPTIGTLTDEPDCGTKCAAYTWVGDLAYGGAVTFTTETGQSTIGGEEGEIYTATVVVSDTLSNGQTDPITGTATGRVTHYANVLPVKSAPTVVGAGQILTYTITASNFGLSTEAPPILTDVVPLSTTLVWAEGDAITTTISDTTTVSWTLPLMGPGDKVVRRFAVRVDPDLVSGTLIINRDYAVQGYGNVLTTAVTGGPPVTTTVQEVGLIDSKKTVTPVLSMPGPANVLTFYIHVVNSSPISLSDVTVDDLLPWENATYQRDASASSGEVISDIVSVRWTGDVGPYDREVITLSVVVDPYFQGAITNTATISHAALAKPVIINAVAYVTADAVLRIHKTASPDPLPKDGVLLYTIDVINLGQEATSLVVTDTLPSNAVYVTGSATDNGIHRNGQLRWQFQRLGSGAQETMQFEVTPSGGTEIANAAYAVTCAEGVWAFGEPVITKIAGTGQVYLPLVLRRR